MITGPINDVVRFCYCNAERQLRNRWDKPNNSDKKIEVFLANKLTFDQRQTTKPASDQRQNKSEMEINFHFIFGLLIVSTHELEWRKSKRGILSLFINQSGLVFWLFCCWENVWSDSLLIMQNIKGERIKRWKRLVGGVNLILS